MKPRRWFRFSLATLLFLVLCVAGLLSGYRSGFELGQRAGEDARIVTVNYQVADLVLPLDAAGTPTGTTADFESLLDVITTTIDPGSWKAVGGPGSIREIYSNLSLEITQTRRGHEKISKMLLELRQGNRQHRKKLMNEKTPPNNRSDY